MTMLKIALCAAVAFALTGCATVQHAALLTCQNEATAVFILSDLRAQGKLSPRVIAIVNKDIEIVDPVCSAKTAHDALTGAEAAAAAEIVSLAGSIK